jgi:putative transposase
MRQPHRKRVRHYDEPGHVHELSFSCYRRMPLLTNDEWRAELCTAIDRAIARHRYRLLAFVLMPEHVHPIGPPGRDSATISGPAAADAALSGLNLLP